MTKLCIAAIIPDRRRVKGNLHHKGRNFNFSKRGAGFHPLGQVLHEKYIKKIKCPGPYLHSMCFIHCKNKLTCILTWGYSMLSEEVMLMQHYKNANGQQTSCRMLKKSTTHFSASSHTELTLAFLSEKRLRLTLFPLQNLPQLDGSVAIHLSTLSSNVTSAWAAKERVYMWETKKCWVCKIRQKQFVVIVTCLFFCVEAH